MNALPGQLMLPLETRFGNNLARKVLGLCSEFGPSGVVAHGASLCRSGRLEALLGAIPEGMAVTTWQHPGGEPSLEQVEALRGLIRELQPAWVAAIGGGSVLDAAKAAAGLGNAPLPLVAYHDGASIPPSSLPFIAVPTTAGTGSEATTVSVLTNLQAGVKKSIRHASFMARLVILDPELLEGCPGPVMAASGMDALTQAVESYCSLGATWLSDAFALKAAALVYASLEPACRGDHSFHSDLLAGSYFAGIALSNARLGLVHGLAHPLGARYHVPHGLACAVCLPHVLEFNRTAIPDRYAELGRIFGGDPLDRVQSLLTRLGLSSPFAGKPIADREAIVAETLASGSTKANPRPVSAEDVHTLLEVLFAPKS